MFSLSPFDINFQEGSSGICRMGLVLEMQNKAMIKNVMLVEDKIHWVELDQKKHRICGKLFFLLWNRWHQWYASVVPKGFGWTENNKSVEPSSSQRKHLSPQLTRLVRSHKDLQGIYWMICNELDAEKCRANRKKSRWSFFWKRKQICMRQMQKHRKEHKRTSSGDGRRQRHLC